VFIRFNPDKYTSGERLYKGCFDFDEQNQLVVDDVEFERRFGELEKVVEQYLEEPHSEEEIHIIKLFFDTE
jgi:hypothetical protein